MKRHPLDILSLLLGLVFLLVAAAYLIGDATDSIPSMVITMPLMMAGLGIAGLVGAVAAMQRADVRAAEVEVATVPAPHVPATGYAPATEATSGAEPASADTVVFPATQPDDRDS